MTKNYSPEKNSQDGNQSTVLKVLGYFLRFFIVAALIAGGVYIGKKWIDNPLKSKRRPPQSSAVVVNVQEVVLTSHPVVIESMGIVNPATAIDISARVGGEIIEVNPELIPGGRLKENEIILKIDRVDYELAKIKSLFEIEKNNLTLDKQDLLIEQRKTELVKAESDLRLELAQQAIAQREHDLLKDIIKEEDKEFIMRRPQLNAVQSAVAKAKSAIKSAEMEKKSAEIAVKEAKNNLRKADLDLERTTVFAPFNSIVRSKSIDDGSQISAGTKLANLVGTDAFWVQVSVPVSKLKWISIPRNNGEKGSAVRVYFEDAWGRDVYRTGEVKRLLTDLESQGRMAELLVEVADPYCILPENAKMPHMILGAYVRVEIDGKAIDNVVKVPRTALRDGENVWVMMPKKTLDIRKVDVVFGDKEYVYVAGGLKNGDLMIISDMPVWTQGMALRLPGDEIKEEGDENDSGSENPDTVSAPEKKEIAKGKEHK